LARSSTSLPVPTLCRPIKILDHLLIRRYHLQNSLFNDRIVIVRISPTCRIIRISPAPSPASTRPSTRSFASTPTSAPRSTDSNYLVRKPFGCAQLSEWCSFSAQRNEALRRLLERATGRTPARFSFVADSTTFYCVLEESGKVILEEKLGAWPASCHCDCA